MLFWEILKSSEELEGLKPKEGVQLETSVDTYIKNCLWIQFMQQIAIWISSKVQSSWFEQGLHEVVAEEGLEVFYSIFFFFFFLVNVCYARHVED